MKPFHRLLCGAAVLMFTTTAHSIPLVVEFPISSAGHFDVYAYLYNATPPGWSTVMIAGDFMDMWGNLRVSAADGRSGNARVTLAIHAELDVRFDDFALGFITPDQAGNFGTMTGADATTAVTVFGGSGMLAECTVYGPVLPSIYATDLLLSFPVELGRDTPIIFSVNHIWVNPVGLTVKDPASSAGFGATAYASATITDVSATLIPDEPATWLLLVAALCAGRVLRCWPRDLRH